MVTRKLTFLTLLLGATAAMAGCVEREKVTTPPVAQKEAQKITEATPAGKIPVIARYLPEGYLPGTLKSFDNDKDLLAAYGFSSDKNILNLSKSSEMTAASYSENGQDTIFIVKYPVKAPIFCIKDLFQFWLNLFFNQWNSNRGRGKILNK